MQRLLALGLVFSVFIVVGPAERAEACSCATVDPTAALEGSDAAFVGTLVEMPDPNRGQGQTMAIWVFEVDQWVKGDLGEKVGVHSGFGDGDCGFSIAVGDQIGVFLHNDNGRPSGGLCSTTSPEAMLGAGEPLVFDGVGPPVFLVASDTGRTRLATLDARGRLIAAVGDDRFGWSVSVCPGNQFLVDVVEDEISVRDLSLETVRVVDPPSSGRPEQIWCLDADAERIMAQVWDETGAAPSLHILGEPEPLRTGNDLLMDVSPSHLAFITLPASGDPNHGTLDIIDLATKEPSRIGPAPNPGNLAFSPSGDKLLLTELEFHDDGSYVTRARVYSPADGQVLWASPPLVNSGVYDWVDDHRLAGDIYPVDADEPIGLIIDIDDGSTMELEPAGWGYQAVGDALVSVSEQGLALTDGDGTTATLALPTPTHRLVAVLDPDATFSMPDTTTTITGSTQEEAAALPPDAGFPVEVAAAAVAGVGLILGVGWWAIRRR